MPESNSPFKVADLRLSFRKRVALPRCEWEKEPIDPMAIRLPDAAVRGVKAVAPETQG